MALAVNTLPYGLRDVAIAALDASDTIVSWVDLPASQTFSFSETEEYTELRGDDRVVAIRGKGPKVEWELDAGGISFEAYAVLAGGTYTESGTTPASVATILKKVTDSRPYFTVEGQAISDSGGDFHVTLFKCRASSTIEGSLTDGEFWVTKASGDAIGNAAEELYEFVNNETSVAIDTTP
jgi:hypothetical protein